MAMPTLAPAVGTPEYPPSDFARRFAPSPDFMVSCGCVPVDLARRRVAILHDVATGLTQLPKGRKNIGEDLPAAALRETCEETGLPFALLPLRFATRATHSEPASGPFPPHDVTDCFDCCEPLAVCAYRCAHTLAFKIVFWFAASGDSTAVPSLDTRHPGEEHLVLEWVAARDAAACMSFDADGQVVAKALGDMRRSGYDI